MLERAFLLGSLAAARSLLPFSWPSVARIGAERERREGKKGKREEEQRHYGFWLRPFLAFLLSVGSWNDREGKRERKKEGKKRIARSKKTYLTERMEQKQERKKERKRET